MKSCKTFELESRSSKVGQVKTSHHEHTKSANWNVFMSILWNIVWVNHFLIGKIEPKIKRKKNQAWTYFGGVLIVTSEKRIVFQIFIFVIQCDKNM
jgi:hypothetical protein